MMQALTVVVALVAAFFCALVAVGQWKKKDYFQASAISALSFANVGLAMAHILGA